MHKLLNENCFPVIPTRLGKIKYCKRSPNKEHCFIESYRFFWGMKKVQLGYRSVSPEEWMALPKEEKTSKAGWLVEYKCKYCKKKKFEEEKM